MKVLLTGHRGYIGTVAADMVRNAGHDVTGLDTDLFTGCDFGKAGKAIPEIKKDIRQLVLSDLQGFDAVLHLAALSNDPLGNLDSDLTYDINHRASVKLAELAKKAGVKRFVFASSCSTYGAAGDDFLTESADLNPVTAYGASPRLRLDIVLNDFVAAALTKGKIHIKSDGTPWRPIVHIRDIIAAMLRV